MQIMTTTRTEILSIVSGLLVLFPGSMRIFSVPLEVLDVHPSHHSETYNKYSYNWYCPPSSWYYHSSNGISSPGGLPLGTATVFMASSQRKPQNLTVSSPSCNHPLHSGCLRFWN